MVTIITIKTVVSTKGSTMNLPHRRVHHCLEPECMHGCPVGAYEKEPDTGIVRHLDDQCIGCEYCILKCPYDAPKYSHKRGIVRKCDMCHQRLTEGEAPACVQACPTEAISIIKINTATLRIENNFLPGAPTPEITLPTTRYVGRDVPASIKAADQSQLTLQPAHWPLAFMLVLTQMGLGLSIVSLFTSTTHAVMGALIFNAGIVAATLHLGQDGPGARGAARCRARAMRVVDRYPPAGGAQESRFLLFRRRKLGRPRACDAGSQKD